jgi:hypothetical protein
MEALLTRTLTDPPPPDYTAASHVYADVRNIWEHSPSEARKHLQAITAGDSNALHIDYTNLMHLLRSAIIDRSDDAHFPDWVFARCAEVLVSVTPDRSALDNESWSHAVAYLFRGAAYTPLSQRSILDHPQNHDLATSLMSKAVGFAELSDSLGAIAVLSRGIIASNVRWWVDSNQITSFFFRPPALRSPLFSHLLEHQVELEKDTDLTGPRPPTGERRLLSMPFALLQRFCTASNPASFVHWALSNHIAMPLPQSVALLEPLVARSDAGYLKEYENLTSPPFASHAGGQTTGVIPLELKKGIFIDVFGTLIDPNDGSVNEGLLRLIKGLMTQTPPRPVFLVSDSPPDELKRVLGAVTVCLPPILAKSDLQSTLLEWLIDDSDPEAQNLHALNYLPPEKGVAMAPALLTDESLFCAESKQDLPLQEARGDATLR